MKRFYDQVSIEQSGDAWQVLLDGKAIKTKSGQAIAIPTHALAETMRGEWAAQGDKVDVSSMTFTRLCGGACEMGAEERASFEEDLTNFGETDLLYYFSDDPALQKKQQALWETALQQLEAWLGVRFERTQGIMPIAQPAKSLERLNKEVISLNDYQLVGMSQLVPALGSLLLGLAVLYEKLDVDEAINLSMLDETHQAEKWGEDAEASARREEKKQAIRHYCEYLTLLVDKKQNLNKAS